MLEAVQETNPKDIIAFAEEKKLFLDLKALAFLKQRNDWKELLGELSKRNEFFVTEEKINDCIVEKKVKIERVERVVVEGTRKRFLAEELEPNYRVLEEFDVTGKSFSEGKIDEFINYFRERFTTLKGMLEKRNVLSPKPLERVEKVPNGKELDVIGMVREKWVTKNGHLAFILEDLDEEVIGIVLKDNAEAAKQGKNVLLDDVIGVKGRKASEKMIIIEEIIWPDIPLRKARHALRPLDLVVTSDMHIGSKLFLEDAFSRFISWLNGATSNEKELEKIGRIKYLIIAGDMVDGCGVYPEQFNELNVPDIYKQYEIFSNYIKQIPEYIEVFVSPGQHDAVRWADPMPAVPKEFVPELYGLKNVHFIGSPSMVELEGLKTLVYHGPGLHGYYSNLDGVKFASPETAMIEALRRRTLMPTYGEKQIIVPEKKDYMLIREIPDIFISADVHHNGFKQYKGTILLNGGCWQKQTEYQLKQGHVPTPCIVPQLSLDSLKLTEHHFTQGEA